MMDLPVELGGAPQLGINRLLIVTTGSAWTTGIPSWLGWLRSAYPDLCVRVVATASAWRFVTRQALACRVSELLDDTWPEDEATARHVELSEWAEAIVVYPATLHFTGRFALGLADSPALLAAQCSTAPIAVAPALPPGGMDSAAFRSHWNTLAGRSNVVLAAPTPVMSMTTGAHDAWGPPPLAEVIELLEQRRVELESTRCAEGDVDLATFLADGAEYD